MLFCYRVPYLFIFALLLLAKLSVAQINDNLTFKGKEKKSDLEVNNLFGKVKSFRQEFFINDENIGYKRYYNYYSDEFFSFNQRGYITQQKNFDKNGNALYRKFIEYDINNRIKETTEYDTLETPYSKTKNIYNAAGLLIERTLETTTNGVLTFKITYNEKGLISSEHVFNGNSIVKCSAYSYDELGNKFVTDSVVISSASNKKFKSQTEKYDNNGNMLEQVSYDIDGKLSLKYEYKFNASNNNIEFACYGTNAVLEGNYIYKFDTKMNMVEEEKFTANKNTTETIIYEYKYDAQGNWIERTTMHHNIPKNIIKRNIIYYQ